MVEKKSKIELKTSEINIMAFETLLIKKRKYIVCAVLIFLLYILIGKIVSLNEQIITLRAQISYYENENEDLRTQVEDLEYENSEYETRIEDLESLIDELESNSIYRNYYFNY